MELTINRKYKGDTYTIGDLDIDGKWFCNTLEDKDRGLNSNMPLSDILKIKKPSVTAIPRGTYKITLDVISPRFGSRPFYKETCGGKLPRLLDVKGFDGVLIHTGNSAEDSSGCILVGLNKAKGKVLESQDTFRKLYAKLKEAHDKGEVLTIKII